MYESHSKKYVLLFALYTKVASPLASEQLLTRLRDENENPMVRFPEDQQSWQHRLPLTQVRHECAEALGDIPGVEIEAEMAKYLDPKVDPVVRESCVVCIVMLNVIQSLTNLHTFCLRSLWIWQITTTARSSSMQMA